MANGNGSGGFAAGMLFGMIVGGAAGLLLAPKSGAETRATLWEQTQGARERLPDTLDNLQDRLESLQDDLSRLGDIVRERVQMANRGDASMGDDDDEPSGPMASGPA